MAILTINSGSSSLKLGLYSDDGRHSLLSASVDGIGRPQAELKVCGPTPDAGDIKSIIAVAHVHEALDAATAAMHERTAKPVTAIGHRIVHGGPSLVAHQRITPEVMRQLEAAVHFAPLHIPPALELLHHAETRYPGVPQFACFDTAFHQTMPPEAYTYALPRPYRDAGVRRYGFHGLSYESAVHTLGADLPEKTVIAHLGSGASVCAVHQGKSIATSMGLSPTGGFPMGTRTGDLDPAIVLLMQRGLPNLPALSTDQVETTLNHESGLKALAGENDMRRLLERERNGDPDAALAIEIFCRGVAQTVAGYASLLDGLDLLVFTGGIGEHSAPIRARIVRLLRFAGAVIDVPQNDSAMPYVISTRESLVTLRVVQADENGQISRHVCDMSMVVNR